MIRTITKGRVGVAAVVAVFGLVAGLAGGALALTFNDTPGTFFEDSIDELTDAGCASGYANGTFQPNQPPTRGQFAYWTTNCGGRIAFDDGGRPLSVFGNYETVAASEAVRLGGASGAGQTQFVHAIGIVEVGSEATDIGAMCATAIKCSIEVSLYQGANKLVTQRADWIAGGSNPNEYKQLVVQAVVEMPTNAGASFTLRPGGVGLKTTTTGKWRSASLSLAVFPFG